MKIKRVFLFRDVLTKTQVIVILVQIKLLALLRALRSLAKK